MLRSSLVCLGTALLLLFGVQLASVVFLLAPSYAEFSWDTHRLGVGIRHVLVGDRFTNVGATFCLLHPVPLLCSLGSAHHFCSTNDSEADAVCDSHALPASSPLPSPSICGCFMDALIGQRVFFSELSYGLPLPGQIGEFVTSSSLGSAASRFARHGIPPDGTNDSSVYAQIAWTLDRVDGAYVVAHRALDDLLFHTKFIVIRTRFAQAVSLTVLRLADFIHNMFPSFVDPVAASDRALHRVLSYLLPLMMASADAISRDAVIAVNALNDLLDAFSFFIDRRVDLRDCASVTSASTSAVCLAVEMLLLQTSTVATMRDDLMSLKEVAEDNKNDLGGHLACASAPQRCMLGVAIQLLLSSQSYLTTDAVELARGKQAGIARSNTP